MFYCWLRDIMSETNITPEGCDNKQKACWWLYYESNEVFSKHTEKLRLFYGI